MCETRYVLLPNLATLGNAVSVASAFRRWGGGGAGPSAGALVSLLRVATNGSAPAECPAAVRATLRNPRTLREDVDDSLWIARHN